MKNWYKSLEGRYSDFPANIQILNVVSDLQKAEKLSSVNKESSTNHLYRALILLDYMVYDPKWKRKLKELLRLREVIGSIIIRKEPLANFDQLINSAILLEPEAYKALNSK